MTGSRGGYRETDRRGRRSLQVYTMRTLIRERERHPRGIVSDYGGTNGDTWPRALARRHPRGIGNDCN